jgi:hypothetical protein
VTRNRPSSAAAERAAEVALPAAGAGGLHPWVGRVVSATPELVACGSYLVAWIAPRALESGFVRLLVLGMLVEFLVLHSSAFLGAVVYGRAKRFQRTLGVLGFGAIYLLFAGAFSLAFRSRAPLVTFGWLLGSRLLTVWIDRKAPEAEHQRQLGLWGASVALYIVLAILTAILPVPRFGLDAAAVALLDLPGSGAWIDHPQKVMAFGALYFGAIAAIELRSK